MQTLAEKILIVLFLCVIRTLSYPVESEDTDVAYRQQYNRDPTFPEQNYGKAIPNLIQGDIIQRGLDTRQSVNNYQQTWTNNMVPYSFDSDYSTTEQTFIKSVLDKIMQSTSNCIQFIPRTSEKDYLSIQKEKGCYSEVGRIGGAQMLSLAPDCYTYSSIWFTGTIMHEVLHALGFWHEHTRPDRDDFITVFYDNIMTDHKYDYNKMSQEDVLQLESYDYYSIMHYSTKTFTVDTIKPTFAPRLNADITQIGQRRYLSAKDVSKIRKLYNCDKELVCPEPRSPRYGTVRKLTDNKIGSKIRYTCGSGYTLVGPSERFCRNDASWSGDDPACLQAYPAVDFCNFDDGTCNWTPMSNYGTWIRKSGSTETDKTGPMFDHTRETSDGYFMYIESSSPSKEGDKFRMRMSGIPYTHYVPSGVCMSFYSNMFGKGIVPGSLRVFVVASDVHDREKLVWRDDGTHNKQQWIRQTITSPIFPYGSSRTMDIIIEAQRGTSWTSDIAVDDIVVTTCNQIMLYGKLIEASSPKVISRNSIG